MIKIGITQRVDFVEKYNETRDALDHKWSELLLQNDCLCVPIPNANFSQKYIKELNLDGIIISGGNDHSSRMYCETLCVDYCVKYSLPLLGFCHGMQFIGQYFGSNLIKLDGHVGSQHVVKIVSNQYEIPAEEFTVNSYHNFTLDEIPEHFLPLSIDKDGYCEAMYHKTMKIVTFMWHPERQPHLTWFNFFIKQFYAKR